MTDIPMTEMTETERKHFYQIVWDALDYQRARLQKQLAREPLARRGKPNPVHHYLAQHLREIDMAASYVRDRGYVAGDTE
jgi:hypothetical protein